jgi:hypothetical protein
MEGGLAVTIARIFLPKLRIQVKPIKHPYDGDGSCMLQPCGDFLSLAKVMTDFEINSLLQRPVTLLMG